VQVLVVVMLMLIVIMQLLTFIVLVQLLASGDHLNVGVVHHHVSPTALSPCNLNVC
jgi:hypothetical protein